MVTITLHCPLSWLLSLSVPKPGRLQSARESPPPPLLQNRTCDFHRIRLLSQRAFCHKAPTEYSAGLEDVRLMP
jgi:hypothetical protein